MVQTETDIAVSGSIRPTRLDWCDLVRRVHSIEPIRQNGRVMQVIGLVIESQGPAGSVGELCYISTLGSESMVPAEIVAVSRKAVCF